MIYLVLIIAIIVLIDFIPIFYTWQSRIHIGRWENKISWSKKLTDKTLFWLHKTPTIKVTDNNRLILIDILKGNYKKNTIQYWQEAALLLGLTQTYNNTKENSIKKEIDRYIASKFDISNQWKTAPKEVDVAILAYAILKIDWLNHKDYKQAYDAIWDLIKSKIGEDQTVKYRENTKDYRYVDTIGFISPFLVRYGIKFNIPEAIDLGVRQITEFNKHALLKDTAIPCHTYNIKTKIPVGLFGWGRGMGWYAIGLIDTWNELKDDHPQKEILTKAIISFAQTAISFQKEDGSWNWLVTDSETRADSSTTATLSWFLANASKISEISLISVEASKKAITYLMKVTRRNGSIDFSQGDTKGIGVYSQNFDILPFTQGFTLRTVNY